MKRIIEIFILFVFLAAPATACASLPDMQAIASSVVPEVSDIITTLTPEQFMEDLIQIARGSKDFMVAVYRSGDLYIISWAQTGCKDPVITFFNASKNSISEAMIVTRQGFADIIQAARSYGFKAIDQLPDWIRQLGQLAPFISLKDGMMQFVAGFEFPVGFDLNILIVPIFTVNGWINDLQFIIEPPKAES